MKKLISFSALALTLLSASAAAVLAQTAAKPMHDMQSAATYQCQKCHMKVSAATAKKDHYKDPMDGGKLLPMTPAKGTAADKSMGGMKM